MGLITLKTFYHSFEAHILKTKLENEGIACCIFDETMMGLYPIFSSPIGGIKLKINEQDLNKVTVLMEQWESED